MLSGIVLLFTLVPSVKIPGAASSSMAEVEAGSGSCWVEVNVAMPIVSSLRGEEILANAKLL